MRGGSVKTGAKNDARRCESQTRKMMRGGKVKAKSDDQLANLKSRVALAKEAPDVVKKMGKDPNKIKMMRGGEFKFGHGFEKFMVATQMFKCLVWMRRKRTNGASGSRDFNMDVGEISGEAYERCIEVRTGYDKDGT